MRNLLAVLATCLGLAACSNDPATTAVAAECAIGSPVLPVELAVLEDFELRVTPALGGERIKNTKASEMLGETHYHLIDKSTRVEQRCVEGDWTYVAITAPDHLTFVRGWAPSATLRAPGRSEAGARVYRVDEIPWFDDTEPYKAELVTALNKVLPATSGCEQVDLGTLARSSSRGTAMDPVFFIACGSGAGIFNVFFDRNGNVRP